MSANIHGPYGCGTLPDGSYECECGHCGGPPDCYVCGTPHDKHGSFPTCASHPYSGDGLCGAVGQLVRGKFVGLPCRGAECKSGCVRAAIGKTAKEPTHG